MSIKTILSILHGLHTFCMRQLPVVPGAGNVKKAVWLIKNLGQQTV